MLADHYQSAASSSISIIIISDDACIRVYYNHGFVRLLSRCDTVKCYRLGYHRHSIRVPHHGLSTAILMEFNHRYFIIQECLLICKLSSLLPLLLIYHLLHIIRNDHLHGNQLDFLIGDDLPCEPMRLSAYTRDC